MSDTEQQSFQAWLRGHFRFDSHDLAEISNLIAVPGLPDVDMPDVLSILAEEDDMQQPSSSLGPHPQSRTSLDSTAAAATNSSMIWPTGQADKAAPPQYATEGCLPPAGDADAPTLIDLQRGFQQQSLSALQLQQAGLFSSEQQQPQLLQTPSQPLWSQTVDQNLSLYPQAVVAANPFIGAATEPSNGLSSHQGHTSSFAGLTLQALYSAQLQAAGPAAGLPTVQDAPVDRHEPELSNKGKQTSSGEFDVSQSSSHSHGQRTRHTRHPAAATHRPAGARTGTSGPRHANTAATAAADAGVQEGVLKRRKRKPSEAQRAAHRRFRQRRKEQMVTLEQEVAAKQAQLQALSVEHTALKAKARALDQLVASAGDGMALLQQLEQLSISQKQQQQQQHPGIEEMHDGHHQQLQLSVSTDDARSPASSSAATSASVAAPTTSSASMQQQQQQQQQQLPVTSALSSEPSSPGIQEEFVQQRQLEQEQLVRAGSIRGSTASPCTSCCAGIITGTLQSQLQLQASRADTVGSIEHLEARLKSILTLPTLDSGRYLLPSERIRVQDGLPKLRDLLKSLVREVMQLLLQIGQETGQGSSLGLDPSPAGYLLCPAGKVPQQEAAATVDLGLLLQQQALGFSQASDAVAAAIAGRGDVEASPTYARLQYLLPQTVNEFRKFAAANRLSLYYAHTLNLETGSLGVPPPAGHWKRVAMLLKDKLTQQVLSDICVARQLYSNTVCSITHQRRMLFLELQRLLDRDGKGGYRTLQVMVDLHGLHGEGIAILDAIDKNMRKEFALEGVYQWMLRKLISPLLSAEILVHSYPYVPDFHSIIGELVQMTEQVPALTALQELQLQQLNSMGHMQQQQQQQQQQMDAGWVGQPLQQQQQQQQPPQKLTAELAYTQQQIVGGLGQSEQQLQQQPVFFPVQ